MRNGLRLALAVGLMLGGCSGDRSSTEPPGPAPSTAAGGGATPDVEPSAIRLERLPTWGFVLGRAHGVEFVDRSGRIVDRLGGFRLYYDWTVPGPVILRSRRVFYTLDVERSRVVPLPSRDAAAELAPQFQEGVDPIHERYLDLDRPLDALADVGFWAYALPSPDGSTLLGQWEGECESQTAFFVRADGSSPRAVTGERSLADARSSSVLGWGRDGAAYVFLGPGGCGSGSSTPAGVYRFTGAGVGRLAIAVSHPNGGRMWGTA
jgi:hypothetical protein